MTTQEVVGKLARTCGDDFQRRLWLDFPMERPAAPVGAPMPRIDGVAKVTGRARYLDDIDAPGVWYGATVRSPIAHGVLEAIDLDPAFDWSTVTVATAADIPGQNHIALIELDQPALVAIGKPVMHVDEAIALVAAPTKELALAAQRAVKPRIRPLPAVFTVEDSLAVKQKLYGEDNVFKEFMVRKGHASDADFEAAIAKAAHVIEGTYYTSPQEQMYIEPQAMMAEWRDGRCYIVGSMQCPYYVHKAMKPLLGLEADDVVLGPGDVVVQRGTNHAWEAVGDEPAVCLGVLIDRDFA